MKTTILTLLAGIAIGILIAPAKGSETWRKLLSSVDDYKNSVADQMDKFADTVKGTVNQAS